MFIRLSTVVVAWFLSAFVVPEASAQIADSARAAPSAGYFIVTRVDGRKCAYPMCGGYFVKLVNQARTRCTDGVLRDECHAADIDFAASGLDEDTAAKFESGLLAKGYGLVRGKLELRNVGSSVRADTLNVAEAWAGQALSTPSGAFFRLSDTGIVCVTAPCPSYLAERLNDTAQRNFDSVDLAASGAGKEAVELGNIELHDTGILGAGRFVQPSRSRAQNFAASEFYLRVKPATGAACGSRGIPPCADDQYCSFSPEAQCGTFDAPGVCAPRPEICNKIYQPVCGCDGVTYGNACEAHAQGVDDAAPGACKK